MSCSSEYSDSEDSSRDYSVYIGTDSDLSASDTERSSAETFVFAALTGATSSSNCPTRQRHR